MVMNKIISIFGLVLLLMSVVSAEDCSSYFDDVEDIRDVLYEDIKILYISSERFFASGEDLEAELDDLDGSDKLDEVSYELETFVRRAEDALSDMNKVDDHLDDYSDDISDARSDIPSACYETYLEFDDDHDDIKRDFADVKNEWSAFSNFLDDVKTFESDPDNYEVSDAESIVRDLVDAIDDYYEEVESMSGPNNIINVGESFSEADCIAMAEVTLQKEKAAWEKSCEDKVTIINNTCDECIYDSITCDDVLDDQKDVLIDCKADNRELQSKYDSLTSSKDSCDSSQADVDRLDILNDKLEDENTKLVGMVNGLNSTLNDYNSVMCEDCGPWFWVALVLFLIMVFGWILTM